MKASELIQLLQMVIEKEGDLRVVRYSREEEDLGDLFISDYQDHTGLIEKVIEIQ